MLTDFNRPRGSVSALLDNGMSVDSFYNSTVVDSYSDLKSFVPEVEGQRAVLLSYQKDTNLGGGLFIARKGSGTDDGGYTAVVNSTWYWERSSNTGKINLTEFGLVDGAALDTPLDNAIKYAIAKKKNYIEIPGLGKGGYTFSGGLAYPCNGINLTIQGPGCSTNYYEGYSSGLIKYTGTGFGLKFYQDAPIRMFNTVKIFGFSVFCTLAASDSTKTSDFSFFYFADSWGFTVEDCFLRNFDNGTGIIIENDRTWTENFIARNVQIRTTTRGWWFRRTTRADNYNSFYGTILENCYFSHDSNVGSSNAILLGGTGTEARPLNTEVNVYSARMEIGGWSTKGGDNSIFVINDGTCINESFIRINYDGLATAGLNSNSQPMRAFIQRGSGWVKARVENNSMQKDYIDLSSLISSGGSTSIYPFAPLIEKRTSITALRALPSTADPVKLIGAKISMRGNVVKGVDSVLRIRQLPLNSNFIVSVASNLTKRTCSQWLFSTKDNTNVGSLKRLDVNPLVSVSSTSNSTVNADNTVTTTTNSTATVTDDRTSSSIYPRLSGGLNNFAATTTYWSEFELYIAGSAITGDTAIDFTLTIECVS